MLEQINDLYNDKAYLNALTDWLSDTYGDESLEVKAAMMLASGEAVIYCDPRAEVNDSWRYDLFTRGSMGYHTEYVIDGVYDHRDTDSGFMTQLDREYFTYRAVNFDGWYRSSAESPLALFDRIVESLQDDEGIDWPSVDEVAI
jgi:hypothetical protein